MKSAKQPSMGEQVKELSGGRRCLFRGLSLLLGLLAGLGIVEIVLRVHPPTPLRPKRALMNLADPQTVIFYCYPSNPNGEFHALPDTSSGDWHLFEYTFEEEPVPLVRLKETPHCVEVRISSQGLRDRVYDEHPRAGVLRICGVGDSFAAGDGVPLKLSLFKQMERQLGKGYEVINTAFPGLSTRLETDLLAKNVERFHCRRAIVVFILNDVNGTLELDAQQDFIHDLINIRVQYLDRHLAAAGYNSRSRLLDLIASRRELGRIEQRTIQWYRDLYDERLNGDNLQLLASDFKQMGETPGCRVVFVIYPLMNNLERDHPFREIHQRVGAMARQAGMPVLDLEPVFRGMQTTSLQVHPTDHHPNGKAHAVAARAIVAWLRRDVPAFLDRKSATVER